MRYRKKGWKQGRAFGMRMFEEEFAELRQAALQAHQSISEYVRSKVAPIAYQSTAKELAIHSQDSLPAKPASAAGQKQKKRSTQIGESLAPEWRKNAVRNSARQKKFIRAGVCEHGRIVLDNGASACRLCFPEN